jgi:hypothetical protein
MLNCLGTPRQLEHLWKLLQSNDRDGIILTCNDERHAQAECARKFELPTSSRWILGFTALVTVLAVVMALAQVLGALLPLMRGEERFGS